jgi:thioredoxin reductase
MPRVSNVCIIGAGSAGLISLHELRMQGIKCVLLEKLPHIAGIWKAQLSNAVYDSLVTNLPKEIMAFSPQYPFREDLPSFVTHLDMDQYLLAFANISNLFEDIKLSCDVSKLNKSADSNKWTVEYTDKDANSTKQLECDAVVVCNGHFNVPVTPHFQGLENFSGDVSHSISYKKPSKYHNKTVLVIGVKSSGTDIARELVGVAGQLHVCVRKHTGPSIVETIRYPEKQNREYDIYLHPSIARIDTKDGECSVVVFVDGERVCVDSIIMATGYQYDLPFLSTTTSSTSISMTSRAVRPLYQHIFHCDDPSLAFVGLPHTIVPFPLFRYQAKWIAAAWRHATYSPEGEDDVVLSTRYLPSKAEREQWLVSHEEKQMGNAEGGGYPANYHNMGAAMWTYLRDIVDALHAGDATVTAEQRCLDGTINGGGRDMVLDDERYLQVMEAIYNDTGARRPKIVGGSDIYRKSQYSVDW